MERPRSGPRDPEAPRTAQKGSPDAKTIGSYQFFAHPSLKSDGLAEVFKRNVKPNQGFRGVDAPNTRKRQTNQSGDACSTGTSLQKGLGSGPVVKSDF